MMREETTRKINSLVIKEGVLIKAFNLNQFLSIPRGIKVLKNECFFTQTALEEVMMADTVERIEENAFEGCEKLRSIIMSPNVEQIGRGAFSDCVSLRVVSLPPQLESLGFGAFNGCKNLGELTMFCKLKRIDGAAFVHTRIHTVNYKGTLLDWLDIDFINSTSNPLNKGAKLNVGSERIKDLVVPAEANEIKNYAFYGCGSLRSVNIKEGVTRIGSYAFGKCLQLTRAYIPKSVEKLGRGVFSGCGTLSITLSEGLFEKLKKKRCPVCQNKLPFYDNQCKHCNSVFNVYED